MSRMYAIELYFEGEMTTQIINGWNLFFGNRLGVQAEPIITLFTGPLLDPLKLYRCLTDFTFRESPFPLMFNEVGSMRIDNGNSVYIEADSGPYLRIFHSRLHDALMRDGIEFDTRHSPNSWVPRCFFTPAVDSTVRLDGAQEVLKNWISRFGGMGKEIRLVEFWPRARLASYRLLYDHRQNRL